MLSKLERNVGIDVLRIIAILMIVMSHIVVTIYQRFDFFGGFAWIASFIIITLSRLGVPIFFMISGYLLVGKERTFSQNLRHTWKRLLIPFIFWSGLTYLGLYFTNNLPRLSWDLVLSGGGTEYYFLIGLSIIYFLNPIIKSITKNSSSQELKFLLFILGISTVGQTVMSFFYSNPPFTIFNYWFLGLFYFIYGQYYRLYREKNKISLGIAIILFFAPLLINLFAIYFIRAHGYSHDLFLENYFGPTVLISSIGLFNIVLKSNFVRLGNKVKSIIVFFSGLSFGVYLVHGIVLDLILHKTKISPYGQVNISIWSFLILASILTISISCLASYTLSKNRFGRVVLGQ